MSRKRKRNSYRPLPKDRMRVDPGTWLEAVRLAAEQDGSPEARAFVPIAELMAEFANDDGVTETGREFCAAASQRLGITEDEAWDIFNGPED